MREHGTKTTPVFLPADGEASWSLLPSSVSLLSGSTRPVNDWIAIALTRAHKHQHLFRCAITTRAKLCMTS